MVNTVDSYLPHTNSYVRNWSFFTEVHGRPETLRSSELKRFDKGNKINSGLTGVSTNPDENLTITVNGQVDQFTGRSRTGRLVNI
jgi:hypothetical protein